jgi:hypothetical protein
VPTGIIPPPIGTGLPIKVSIFQNVRARRPKFDDPEQKREAAAQPVWPIPSGGWPKPTGWRN